MWNFKGSYLHGGDVYGYGDIIDFSSSLNPFGMSDEIRAALRDAASGSDIYPYPECRSLRSAIAATEGVSPEAVVCGAGCAELIYRFVFAVRPRRAVLFAPTFSEYERALRLAGAEVAFCHGRELSMQADDLCAMLTDDVDMAFVCNPNNPTGELISGGDIKKIAEHCRERGIALCVDECFLDFADGGDESSAKELLAEDGRLVVLKAYTKIFSMAGVRLGYALCKNYDLCRMAQEVLSPWSVSYPAQVSGIRAAELYADKIYLSRVREYVSRERRFLSAALSSLGCEVYDGSANFVLFRSVSSLKEGLIERGILIRDCADFNGLADGFYRVAVRLHEDNERLIRALKDEL